MREVIRREEERERDCKRETGWKGEREGIKRERESCMDLWFSLSFKVGYKNYTKSFRVVPISSRIMTGRYLGRYKLPNYLTLFLNLGFYVSLLVGRHT